MQTLEKQLFRALWSGAILFVLIVLGCALSVALMVYFNQYELGLIFPTIGVLCMVFGEKVLRAMEAAGGEDPGGAGSTLIRSIVVAIVVVTIPTLCWSLVLTVSDFMVSGMTAGNFPKDAAELSSMFKS